MITLKESILSQMGMGEAADINRWSVYFDVANEIIEAIEKIMEKDGHRLLPTQYEIANDTLVNNAHRILINIHPDDPKAYADEDDRKPLFKTIRKEIAKIIRKHEGYGVRKKSFGGSIGSTGGNTIDVTAPKFIEDGLICVRDKYRLTNTLIQIWGVEVTVWTQNRRNKLAVEKLTKKDRESV